ncbi:MAG: type II toxin-antitoxin system YafQ family toxin [Faecalibacterium sp.]
MLKLNTSTQFKKDYKTCIKRHYKMDLLQAVVDVLRVPDALPHTAGLDLIIGRQKNLVATGTHPICSV